MLHELVAASLLPSFWTEQLPSPKPRGQLIEVNTTNSLELLLSRQEPMLLSCVSPSNYTAKEIHSWRRPHWKTLSHQRLFKVMQRMTFCTSKRKDRSVLRSSSMTDCCPHLCCPSGTPWKKLKLKTFSNWMEKTEIRVGDKIIKLREERQLLGLFVIQMSRLF